MQNFITRSKRHRLHHDDRVILFSTVYYWKSCYSCSALTGSNYTPPPLPSLLYPIIEVSNPCPYLKLLHHIKKPDRGGEFQSDYFSHFYSWARIDSGLNSAVLNRTLSSNRIIHSNRIKHKIQHSNCICILHYGT